MAALVAFHQRRKQDSRERLLVAAMTTFCDRGYQAASVEDIASTAGVSRMTFYRHFSSKADIAVDLFKIAAEEAMPRYLRLTSLPFWNRDTVIEWLTTLFEADQASRRLLRVFTQATADENGFTERAQELIRDLIQRFGTTIRAFAVDPDKPDERRQWLEAWLVIYEILDQSNHAALDSGVAADPLVIDILSDRFLHFVTAYSAL